MNNIHINPIELLEDLVLEQVRQDLIIHKIRDRWLD